jgi:hypothetical protein
MAAVHWHFDPQWTLNVQDRHASITQGGQRVGLVVPQGRLEQFVADEETGLGWYSPVYGRIERTTTVRLSHSGTAPFWMVSVFGLDPENPVVDVDWVPVWAEAGALAHGRAMRISRATSVDHVLFAEPSGQDLTAQAASLAEDRLFCAGSANAAEEPMAGTWRIGDLDTNARMLFWRATREGAVTRLALVDGSMVRGAGRRGFHVALPRIEPDFFIDRPQIQAETRHQEPRTKDPCAVLPVS